MIHARITASAGFAPTPDRTVALEVDDGFAALVLAERDERRGLAADGGAIGSPRIDASAR